MNRMKKTVSLLIAAVLIIGLLPSFAFADIIGGSGFGSTNSGFASAGTESYTVTVGETVTVKSSHAGTTWKAASGSECVSLDDIDSGLSSSSVKVTGLKAGTAEITHTYKTIVGSLATETFTVTVEAAPETEKQLFFTSSHSGRKAHRGEKITLTAHVIGYEAYDYEIVWQYSEDGGSTFTDAGTGASYTYKETKENVGWLWRFVLVEK